MTAPKNHDYSSMTAELKHQIIEFGHLSETPLDERLEALIAKTDDPDISWWVGLTHGLKTATVESHLAREQDAETRKLLMTNPEAPLEAMKQARTNDHTLYSLQRFLERVGADLEGDRAAALCECQDKRPLGIVWDELVSRFAN